MKTSTRLALAASVVSIVGVIILDTNKGFGIDL